MKKLNKKQVRKIRDIVSIILMLIGIIAIGIYIVLTLKSINDMKVGSDVFKKLKSPIITEEEDNNSGMQPAGNTQTEDTEGITMLKDLIPELQSVYNNEEVIAYIDYEEAGISYPVVQGKTTDEYLRLSPYKKYSSAGSIILDSQNSYYFYDTASLIYGHHMQDGTMFGKLEKHISEVGLGEIFYIYTKDQVITYKVVAWENIDPSDRESWIQIGFGYGENFVNTIKAKSSAKDLPEDLYGNERYVTLVTCRYLAQGGKSRFGVTGVEIDRRYYD